MENDAHGHLSGVCRGGTDIGFSLVCLIAASPVRLAYVFAHEIAHALRYADGVVSDAPVKRLIDSREWRKAKTKLRLAAIAEAMRADSREEERAVDAICRRWRFRDKKR